MSRRWTLARKEALVLLVRSGKADINKLAQIHDLDAEEINAWVRRYQAEGLKGLCVTKVQKVDGRPRQRRGGPLGALSTDELTYRISAALAKRGR